MLSRIRSSSGLFLFWSNRVVSFQQAFSVCAVTVRHLPLFRHGFSSSADYLLFNGLRHVKPYKQFLTTRTKGSSCGCCLSCKLLDSLNFLLFPGRWVGRSLIDCLSSEFSSYFSKEEFEQRITEGLIKVLIFPDGFLLYILCSCSIGQRQSCRSFS
jgi:hypothetical protein